MGYGVLNISVDLFTCSIIICTDIIWSNKIQKQRKRLQHTERQKDRQIKSHSGGIRLVYFMLPGRISRNIGENIFRSYTGTTSENTDFQVLVA